MTRILFAVLLMTLAGCATKPWIWLLFGRLRQWRFGSETQQSGTGEAVFADGADAFGIAKCRWRLVRE